MLRKKLSGDIGVVFGTFAPLHVGHVDLIHTAKRNHNGGAVVLVSGREDNDDRGTRSGLPLGKRTRYVREVFANDSLVAVEKLDEVGLPLYPDGWTPWVLRLGTVLAGAVNTTGLTGITFYVGEPEYKDELLLRILPLLGAMGITEELPVSVVVVDRSVIPISATQIRNNPRKYWKYITKPFRRCYTKKVLVLGSASGGKTTLVQDLGRYYNAGISLEYAREYQQKYNVRDEELSSYDYVHFFADQYAQTSRVIDEGNTGGLVIADTNSIVTKAYVDFYLRGDGVTKESDLELLDSLYSSTVAKEKWDLILLTLPESEYVDDGFRDMSMATENIRNGFTSALINLVEERGWGNKLVVLGGSNYLGTDGSNLPYFTGNYAHAKALIDELVDEGE